MFKMRGGFAFLLLLFTVLFFSQCYNNNNFYKGGGANAKFKGKALSKTAAFSYEERSDASIGIASDSTKRRIKEQMNQMLTERNHPEVAMLYEKYQSYTENEWIPALKESKSTFSIDVDNASYTNFRRHINNGQLPPKDAIRVEEWLNFFNYELEAPVVTDGHPIKITSEISPCPWNPEHDLLMLKMQAVKIPKENLPASNLVFLLDVSGSMGGDDKLDLLKKSMHTLVGELRAQDRVSIVTYAGTSKIILKPTAGNQKEVIFRAIKGLKAGGSTYGSEGIKTAYKLAEENFDSKGNNRIILASDGDWNIGVTNNDKLVELIEEKRESGIYLSVLGFGTGNLNDALMEQLADNGNGNYGYIDSEKESNRVFKTEFAGAIYVIANDVKLQVEFDSTVVSSYRLLGYENRVLENWQFDADSIDAGDLGIGQNVVAFYQIKRKKNAHGKLGKVDFRYKPIKSNVSKLVSHEFQDKKDPSVDFNFASCVIEYALCLKESKYRNGALMERAILRGKQNLGPEENQLGYEKRVEFVGLMEKGMEGWTEYVVSESKQSLKNKEEDKLTVIDEVDFKLKLYPNPAVDYVTIEVPKKLANDWSVQVFGLNGQLFLIADFKEKNEGKLAVNELLPGNYIVKIYGNGYNYGYLRMSIM